MSKRNQPYIPLYVQDFQTDEKLLECSASATGVYIRLICVLHKSDEYGTIELKDKDKSTNDPIKNFAIKLLRYFPYDLDTIENGLKELIKENVVLLEGDKLIQKRMVKDNIAIKLKSKAGKIGWQKGLKTLLERNTVENAGISPEQYKHTTNGQNDGKTHLNSVKNDPLFSKEDQTDTENKSVDLVDLVDKKHYSAKM